MTKPAHTDIGIRLRRALQLLDVNMAQASRRSAIPYRSLQNYARGHREPSASSLKAISEQLGISADWLLTGIGTPLLGANQDTPMPTELHTLRQAKLAAEAEMEAARMRANEARQILAAAQREEKQALARFEAARLAWIEAAEAHYGAPDHV